MSRDHPRLLIECSPVLDPYLLGHGYLHIVHVSPVPDLLEERIGEAEEDDVVYRLFGKIVVDAIYLASRRRHSTRMPLSSVADCLSAPKGFSTTDLRAVQPLHRRGPSIFERERHHLRRHGHVVDQSFVPLRPACIRCPVGLESLEVSHRSGSCPANKRDGGEVIPLPLVERRLPRPPDRFFP